MAEDWIRGHVEDGGSKLPRVRECCTAVGEREKMWIMAGDGGCAFVYLFDGQTRWFTFT